MTREARCACGALTLTAEGDPMVQGVCSCLDCQWRTGSPISDNAAFPAASIQTAGPEKTWSRKGDSGGDVVFHLCPTCGTTLYWTLGGSTAFYVVAVGCFADKDFPVPNSAVYGERRPAWICLSETIKEGW